MADGFEALIEELNRAMEQRVDPEVVQVRITDFAPEGSMVVVPMVGENAERHQLRGIERPQELLVHPNDWRRVKQTLPRFAGVPTMPREAMVPSVIVGLPIVNG